MAKVFKCRYKGLDCDFAAHGNSDEEIIERTYDHARAVHDCLYSVEEFGDQIRDEIRIERRLRLPWTRGDASA
jgi:predicted small metal-binding protein